MTAATPGRRLGRYHLVEPLGGGPCGEVYRAKVVGVAGMERQLAVKRFHPQVLATPGVSGRLSQAARVYGGLDHPRLARLAELGVAGGETFTAVEWVNGLDLARLLVMARETNAAIPAGASLSLISAAARAIGYAHGRGVSHLGLAPTNVIATNDGDIKITDVGILSCRLPPRPSQDPSLATRLSYLAPEQLIGEPVSAATDVFVLGVMAYELISGARPFGGNSSLELEQSVLSGRPSPLELPRPVSRVIDRCLARSPFERFPDARALADALDAALRLSPLAGNKRDIADRVGAALEHIARINEQQLSGALSFAVPTPPPGPHHRGSAVTTLPLPPPSKGLSGAAPALSRPRPPSSSPPLPATGQTLRGSPPAKPRPPTELTRDPTLDLDESDERNLAVGDQTLPRIQPLWPPTEQVPTLKPPPPQPPPVPGLNRTLITAGGPPPPPPPMRPLGSNPPPFDARTPQQPEAPLHLAEGSPHPIGPPPSFGPPMVTAPPPPPYPQQPPPPHPVSSGAPRLDRRLVIMMLVLLILGITGVGGFFIHRMVTGDSGTIRGAGVLLDAATVAAAAAPDAGVVAVDPKPDAAAPEVELDAGATVAMAPPADAGPDAGATVAIEPHPTVDDADGKLVIKSEPAGAHVFLDGADQGKTPVTVAGTGDRLDIAVVMPGYDLYLAQVDGHGTHVAKLEAVSPPEGPGGIKVRCKADDRYYVFLDGKPTGQLCPTERLGVDKGDHSVEVYDLVGEQRRQFTAKVKETRVSVRVRVDY